MTEMARLKPCPFCGSSHIVCEGVSSNWRDGTVDVCVECEDCLGNGPVITAGVKPSASSGYDVAKSRWNERKDGSPGSHGTAPCPFCGKTVLGVEAMMGDGDVHSLSWTYCQSCGCEGPQVRSDGRLDFVAACGAAVAAWNRRLQ